MNRFMIPHRDIQKIADFTYNNNHTDARWLLAVVIDNQKLVDQYSEISEQIDSLGYASMEVLDTRMELDQELKVAVRAKAMNADAVLAAL